MGRTLLHGGEVLVGDPGLGRVEAADLLIEDGRIAAIGPGLEADAERIDAGGRLAIPGFVDTHRHLWQTAMRGICADWTLLDYFLGIRVNAAAVYTPDDVYAGNYVGALEALDAGVTCVLDFSHCLNSPEHADEAVRGLREAGIRGTFAYGMYPVPLEAPAFAGVEERAADARRVRERHFSSPDGLLGMGIALTELGLVPWETTIAEVELARELDAPVSAHIGTVWSDRRRPEVALLHAAGLLGERQVHVHCNACSGRELDLLADAGASVSVTPETELQMGMGFPVTQRLLERGMIPSLGCDIVSNNRGDLFTQMRLGLACERARTNETELRAGVMPETLTLSAAEMLSFATLGGAKALGLEREIGSIEIGKAADLVLLRADGPAFSPANDPVAQIVMQAGINEVDGVLVAGRPVKLAGSLIGDDARARELAFQSRDRIAAAVEPRGGFLPPAPEGWFEATLDAFEANLGSAPKVKD
ncbi:MAG TPA: amidohydrolase family protein [Solirubrobacterales bacterium]|jgi:cytosine/adenosine deaminase-related metal-dependent hydrolase